MNRMLLALSLVGLAACAELPDRQLIIEHRVLAAQVVVVDALDPSEDSAMSRNQALPLETVQLQPFAVDPTSVTPLDAIDPVWIACELFPGRGPFGCLQDAMPMELDAIPVCVAPTLEELADGPPQVASPCLIGRTAITQFTVPPSQGVLAGAAIEATLIAGSPGGTETGECAAQLLTGESDTPDDCLYGVQVVSVGPTGRVLELAMEFGVDLGDLERPPPALIDEPDRNPRITSFRVTILDEEDNEVVAPQDVPRGGVVAAASGQTLRIDTTSPEEDLQPFRVPINNGESFEDRREAYVGDWFRTWGEQLSPASADPESYNEWTLTRGGQDETDLPPDGVAHLYYVVRDTRGGVNWWWFSVRLTE